MEWLERLNQTERAVELDGAVAEVLHWAYADALPDNTPHRHTYFEACQVGARGSGLFLVDGREHVLRPGDVFLARPGVMHQIVNRALPCMELAWVAYQLRPIPGGRLTGTWRAFSASPLVLSRDAGGQVAGTWRALRALAPVAGPGVLHHLVCALLLAVADAFVPGVGGDQSAVRAGPPVSRSVRLALRYIHDNLDRPLQMADLSQQVGVSPRHLARLIRAQAGVPFHEYVRGLRIQFAAHLLRRSDLPVKAIGAQVGYPDIHHFTRVFSARVGCPPAAYRRGATPDVSNVQSPGPLV